MVSGLIPPGWETQWCKCPFLYFYFHVLPYSAAGLQISLGMLVEYVDYQMFDNWIKVVELWYLTLNDDSIRVVFNAGMEQF